MPLKFGEGVPEWVKKQSRKCYRDFCLQDWNIKVFWCDLPKQRKVIYGDCYYPPDLNPEYLAGTIRFSNTIKGRLGMGIIYHEFRHVFYARTGLLLRNIYRVIRANKMSVRSANHMAEAIIDSNIHELIEKDVTLAGYPRLTE